VLDTGNIYGKQLFLDCMPQSSEADEFIYHEALVQPALTAHPNPKRVFIAGGGEGGTAREILRHHSVKEVVMVDLDPALVEVTEKHLPYWQGVKADPRFKLIVGDAIAWMKEFVKSGQQDKFDIVIFDLPDAVKDTAWLYSSDIFKLMRQIMADGAIFGTHSGGNVCIPHDEELSGYPGEPCNFIPRMHNTFKQLWNRSSIAVSPMPLWQEFHGFMFATNATPPHELSGREVDQRLQSKLAPAGTESHPNLKGQLRYYSGMTHSNMFFMQPFYKTFIQSVPETLTPEMIEKSFKNSKANDEGLSEMKICRCDPTLCVYHNGLKGPLMRESDVYETDGDDVSVDPQNPDGPPVIEAPAETDAATSEAAGADAATSEAAGADAASDAAGADAANDAAGANAASDAAGANAASDAGGAGGDSKNAGTKAERQEL